MSPNDPEYVKALAKAREVVGRFAHVPQGGPRPDGDTPATHVLTFALTSGVLKPKEADGIQGLRAALLRGRALTDPSFGWPYEFDTERLSAALEKAQTDPWYHDGLAYVASVCLSRGAALPAPLMVFACCVLAGTISRPKQTKRWSQKEAPSFWHWVASHAVHQVMLAAAVPVTVNADNRPSKERPNPANTTAAAAVASALNEAARKPNTEAAVAAAWNNDAQIGMLAHWMSQIRTK